MGRTRQEPAPPTATSSWVSASQRRLRACWVMHSNATFHSHLPPRGLRQAAQRVSRILSLWGQRRWRTICRMLSITRKVQHVSSSFCLHLSPIGYAISTDLHIGAQRLPVFTSVLQCPQLICYIFCEHAETGESGHGIRLGHSFMNFMSTTPREWHTLIGQGIQPLGLHHLAANPWTSKEPLRRSCTFGFRIGGACQSR